MGPEKMSKRKVNQLLIGDTLYDLTEAYRNGARACRSETPFWANPHRDGSQRHADWSYGHDNEAGGHHRVSVTLDVIEARPAGLEFTAPEEEGPLSDPAVPAYKAYTTDYDETVRASDLLNAMSDRRPEIRDLMRRFGPDHEGTWTGTERAAAAVAISDLKAGLEERGSARPILFLLDNSGSMRGRQTAALVGILERVGPLLEQSGVPFEVLGFTTRSWKGGRSRERWINEGRPADPGRLCDLRHLVYKSAADPWDPDPMSLMFAEGVLKENVDGEALLWAADRARALGGATILHVTDGTPMDQSTLAANPSDYLEWHLQDVRKEINRDPDVGLLTIRLTPDLGQIAELVSGGVLSLLDGNPTYHAEEAPGMP